MVRFLSKYIFGILIFKNESSVVLEDMFILSFDFGFDVIF